jgi:GNAT superfamily N-acetyltransferase
VSASAPHRGGIDVQFSRSLPVRSIEIRFVESGDFDAWMPLWRGYQRFYKIGIPERVTRATWERFLDPVEPMHAALALQGDRALGLVHSIYHRSAWTTSDHCYLQDLFVAPGARGMSVGRSLIEHVCADARRRGASRVYWLTHESNRRAMLLYDRIAKRAPVIQYRREFDGAS